MCHGCILVRTQSKSGKFQDYPVLFQCCQWLCQVPLLFFIFVLSNFCFNIPLPNFTHLVFHDQIFSNCLEWEKKQNKTKQTTKHGEAKWRYVHWNAKLFKSKLLTNDLNDETVNKAGAFPQILFLLVSVCDMHHRRPWRNHQTFLLLLNQTHDDHRKMLDQMQLQESRPIM